MTVPWVATDTDTGSTATMKTVLQPKSESKVKVKLIDKKLDTKLEKKVKVELSQERQKPESENRMKGRFNTDSEQ